MRAIASSGVVLQHADTMRRLSFVSSCRIEQKANQIAALIINGRVFVRTIPSVVDDAREKPMNSRFRSNARRAIRTIRSNCAKRIAVRAFGVRMSEFLRGFVGHLDDEQFERIEVGVTREGQMNTWLEERERAFTNVHELSGLVFLGAYPRKYGSLFGCLDVSSVLDDFACITNIRRQFMIAPGCNLGQAVVVVMDGVAKGHEPVFGVQFEHARVLAPRMKLGFAFAPVAETSRNVGEDHHLVFVAMVEVEADAQVFGESAQKGQVGFAVLNDELAYGIGALKVHDHIFTGQTDPIEFGLEKLGDGGPEEDLLHEAEFEPFGARGDAESINALLSGVGEVVVDFGNDTVDALGVVFVGGIENDGHGLAEDFGNGQAFVVEAGDEQVEGIEAGDGRAGGQLHDAEVVAVELRRMQRDLEDGPSV